MRNRWLGAVPALALLVIFGLISAPALAQTTGTIEGTVADSNGAPLPGVSVDIRSAALLGTRTVVSDAAGRYKFPVLPPGIYTVSAALSGFTKVEKTNVRVSIGGTVTLPVILTVSIKEEIVVTGEAPVVDTTRTVIGSTTTLSAIQKLPLARSFTSIATTVAGTGTSTGGGISVYGATGLENQYIIDGVNTTGVKIGDQGKAMNTEFIQEVEVKTGGYEAEFSRALGGVINVVTKSGGNEFHGDVFGYYDSDNLTANDKNVGDAALGTGKAGVGVAPYVGPARYDIGADLGGFLMKDRIWFWAGYNHVNRTEDTEMYTGRSATGGVIDPLAVTNETKRNLFSGKMTFRIGESHTVAVSAFGDPGSFDGVLQGIVGNPKANLGTNDFGGTDFSAKWDGIFGTKFLAQVQASRHEESDDNYPLGSESVTSARNVQFGVSTWYTEGSPTIQREDYKRDNYKGAITMFLGAHEVKGGLDYEDITGNYYGAYSGKARVTNSLANNGDLNYVSNRYYAQVRNGGPNCAYKYDAAGNVVTGNFGTPGPANPNGVLSIYDCAGYEVATAVVNTPKTQNFGFFFQDSWKVFPNLTINAGVRYDDQKLKDADGNERISLKDEWSPRLGVVWDFTNNGKSKFFAHYGRYYTVIPTDIQTRALGNEYTVFAYNYNQGVFDPVDSAGGYAYIQGGQITPQGLKGMYQDEYVGGIEYELFKNWSFGLKGIYKSLGRAIEDRCDLTDSRLPYLADYIPAGALTTCALINPGQMGDLGKLKDPTDPACVGPDGNLTGNCESTNVRRYYRGVELTANHRFSNSFYMLASYVYSSLKGNYDGNEKQSTGQQDPNINADFDYIDMIPNNFGRLSLDRKHQLKLSGNYAFAFGLSAGASFRYVSGAPYAVRGYARPGYTSELYLVANRGEVGDLPSQYEMDLHLEYNLRLGNFTITPLVDVFNLLNRQGATSRSGVFNTKTDGNRKGLDNRYNLPNATFGAASRNDAAACLANPSYSTWGCSTNKNYQKDNAWQDPLSVRIGARVSF